MARARDMVSSVSSNGSSTAPENFLLSSDLDDDNNRSGYNVLRCPLCQNERRSFYCKHCVQHGEFVHSISVYSERFIDKQQRLFRIQKSTSQLRDRCSDAFEKHRRRAELLYNINVCKERIRLLNEIKSETSQNIIKGNESINALKKVNVDTALRLPKHVEQIEKLRKKVTDMKIKKEKQKESVEKKRQQLKKVIRTAVKQLIKYIFPLSIVEPSKSNEGDQSSTDVVTSAIADASGTSYVRGKWINDTENSLKIHHKIVAPTLPGSGDYSAYTLWMSENRDGVPSGNKGNVMHNPAWNTVAALTYASQLVNVLSYYLNVRLPYKLAYSEFCGSEVSDQKFAKKVARLNSNILHLCFTQNTDTSVLQPMHTLQNLMYLLNTDVSDLGRVGPIVVDPVIITNLYNQLVPDLENSDDSTSDEEEDAFNWEWEAVPNIACPEMVIPIPGAMNSQSSSMQVNQSVAGGLVTSAAASIASIWRGWTTN
ncbi:beclin 1-associated autophagy-related key regulator [Phymastichus coffea]|uniref:beclin 1-associated autophagy-related key regulator n=1 Tax=Phymastichus coffea TaxID=108790 RepID=UPI00273C513A|nr:beclin 1-associated autophagy-related key regulator [Phymastichus coffea]